MAARRPVHLALLPFALLAAGCAAPASPAGAPEAAIQGSVTYLQRIALTEGAVLEVVLLESAGADGPARAVAETAMDSPGQVPIAFTLPYDPASIDPARAYSLSARIEDGGRAFVTPEPVPVLTGGAPATAEILLQPETPPQP